MEKIMNLQLKQQHYIKEYGKQAYTKTLKPAIESGLVNAKSFMKQKV